jgi:hypothetical protein
MNYKKENRKMKQKMMMLTLLVVGFVGSLWSQPPGGGPKREKIEAMKVAFLTKKLDLTTEEAQKFWPVYNKFSDEMEKNKRAFRIRAMEEAGNVESMTDAEAEKALNEMLAFRAAEVEVLKKYTAEFKKVLPPQKVVKLFVAEQEFKRELLKMLRDQRGR